MHNLSPARRPQAPLHGMGDAGSAVSRLVGSVASAGVVRSVTIRSNISPDITLDPRAYAVDPRTGRPMGGERRGVFTEALLRFAKPEIEVETAAGRIRVAPYGAPTTNLFWPVVIFGAMGGIALGILAVKQMRKNRRRAAAA